MLKKIIKNAAVMICIITVGLSVLHVSASSSESGDEWASSPAPRTRVRYRRSQHPIERSIEGGSRLYHVDDMDIDSDSSGDSSFRRMSDEALALLMEGVVRRPDFRNSEVESLIEGALNQRRSFSEGPPHESWEFVLLRGEVLDQLRSRGDDGIASLIKEVVRRLQRRSDSFVGLIEGALEALPAVSSDGSSSEIEGDDDEMWVSSSEADSDDEEYAGSSEIEGEEEWYADSSEIEGEEEGYASISDDEESIGSSSEHESVEPDDVKFLINIENLGSALAAIDQLSPENLVSKEGAKSLHAAIVSNNSELVNEIAKKLIEIGVPLVLDEAPLGPAGVSIPPVSLLYAALINDKQEIVNAILNQASDLINKIFVNEEMEKGGPWGTEYDDSEPGNVIFRQAPLIWKLLAGYDGQYDTPLIVAIKKGWIDEALRILELLHMINDHWDEEGDKHGDFKEYEDTSETNTPLLQHAIDKLVIDKVREGEGRWTALPLAVSRQALKLVAKLLKYGPELKALSYYLDPKASKTVVDMAQEAVDSAPEGEDKQEAEAIKSLLDLYKRKKKYEGVINQRLNRFVPDDEFEQAKASLKKVEKKIKKFEKTHHLVDESSDESSDESLDESEGDIGEPEPPLKRRRIEE